MNWQWFIFLPFLIQIAVISLDEFYFHHKRGLPIWERIGHPVDTFSVVLFIAYVLVFPFSSTALIPLVILGAISCLLVTKDEFVHKEACDAKEQWLHALLFLNHPIVLFCIGWMWKQGAFYRPFLLVQLCFSALFCFYQLVYWNLVWKEK